MDVPLILDETGRPQIDGHHEPLALIMVVVESLCHVVADRVDTDTSRLLVRQEKLG